VGGGGLTLSLLLLRTTWAHGITRLHLYPRGMINSLKVAIPATIFPVLAASVASIRVCQVFISRQGFPVYRDRGIDDSSTTDDSGTAFSDHEQAGERLTLMPGLWWSTQPGAFRGFSTL